MVYRHRFPQIADKLTKFPLVEIGQDVRKTLKNMNTAIESTDKLVKQLDGKVAPGLQATLDDVRKTVRSSESILSSDAPLQQDVRKALQQMTRAAASLQLMADYIEQHPESIIRGRDQRPTMKNKKNRSLQHSKVAKWLLGSGVLTAIAMTACSSSPTPNYYTLTPKVTPVSNSTVQVIEVLPVGIPDRFRPCTIGATRK